MNADVCPTCANTGVVVTLVPRGPAPAAPYIDPCPDPWHWKRDAVGVAPEGCSPRCSGGKHVNPCSEAEAIGEGLAWSQGE